MADTHRASQIPVMSPRASHSGSNSLSALPSPHLGLVPPSRYPSVSGSPSIVSPPTSPSPPSSGGGSTPFRTFRNFLSFGSSNKHSSSPSVPSAIPKSHFSTLGPIRRSVNVERRASSPQLARRSEDDYVLSIDVPRPGDEKPPNTRLSKSSNASPVSHSPFSDSQSSVAESAGASPPLTLNYTHIYPYVPRLRQQAHPHFSHPSSPPFLRRRPLGSRSTYPVLIPHRPRASARPTSARTRSSLKHFTPHRAIPGMVAHRHQMIPPHWISLPQSSRARFSLRFRRRVGSRTG